MRIDTLETRVGVDGKTYIVKAVRESSFVKAHAFVECGITRTYFGTASEATAYLDRLLGATGGWNAGTTSAGRRD